MKLRKYIHYFAGCVLGTLTLSSCLNNDDPEGFVSTLATVHLSEKGPTELDSDSYGLVTLQNPGVLAWADADSTGQRILAGIRFLEDKSQSGKPTVQIVEIIKALTKRADDLRTEGSEDIFGHSPIQITSASISKEHLNIQYLISQATAQKPHRISLVLTDETRIDEDGLLSVEFRHQTEGDHGIDQFWGIVSYTLNSIPDYDRNRVKGFRIKYHSGADSQAEWIVKSDGSQIQSQQRPHRYTPTY